MCRPCAAFGAGADAASSFRVIRKPTARTGRVAASSVPVDYVGLDGQDLPLDDGSVDHVLTTWTLCTIPDVERALGEIRRVLRPGGALHFVEHGRAPDPKVARWQDRLTPIQRRIAGGCHLNRPIDELIAGVGLDVGRIDNYYLRWTQGVRLHVRRHRDQGVNDLTLR